MQQFAFLQIGLQDENPETPEQTLTTIQFLLKRIED